MALPSTAPEHRAARITAGLGANGVTQLSQLFIRLAEVPVLLTFWGAAGYGEWLLVAALPTALSFSDGGFTRTARREMTMRAGRGDVAGIARVFQSAWVLLLLLSAVVMLLLALILPQLPLVHWLQLKTVHASGLVLAVLALGAQVLVYFQCGLLHGALTSRGRYAIGELFITLSALLSFGGLLAGAALGKGISGAACGSLFGQVAGYGIMLAAYIRTSTSPRYGFRQASLREIKALWKPSVANLAFPMADALNVQGVRLVVGLTLGPVALAVFSTTRTLCRVALQPVMSIARTLEPELSLVNGGANEDQARRLFLKASHAAFWLSLALCLVVAAIGPFFYQLWAGRQLELNLLALPLMLAASILSVVWGVALTVPCAVNKHSTLSLQFLILYGAGTVLLVSGLTRLGLGTSGAALGVLLGDAIATYIVVIVSLRLTRSSFGGWLRTIIDSPAELTTEIRARARVALANGFHK